MLAGTSIDQVTDTLASTQLGGSTQQCLTDSAFPHQSSDSFIVLLHNEATKSVRLHDVVDVIGVLDPLLHEDGAHMDVQDDFDEFMEEEEVIDEAVDAENMGGNENSAVPTPRRPKVMFIYSACLCDSNSSLDLYVDTFMLDGFLGTLALLFADTTLQSMSCNGVWSTMSNLTSVYY